MVCMLWSACPTDAGTSVSTPKMGATALHPAHPARWCCCTSTFQASRSCKTSSSCCHATRSTPPSGTVPQQREHFTAHLPIPKPPGLGSTPCWRAGPALAARCRMNAARRCRASGRTAKPCICPDWQRGKVQRHKLSSCSCMQTLLSRHVSFSGQVYKETGRDRPAGAQSPSSTGKHQHHQKPKPSEPQPQRGHT